MSSDTVTSPQALTGPAEVSESRAGAIYAEVAQEHVVDYILDTLSKKLIRPRKKEKVDIPSLSVTGIATSLVRINQRLKALAVIQPFIKRFISWEQPAFTLSILCVYTILCFRPYLFACIPILGILGGVMAPGFEHRHPFPQQLLPNSLPRPSEANDYTDSVEEQLAAFPRKHSVGPETEGSVVDRSSKEEEEAVASRKDVLTSIREVQAALAHFAQALDNVEEFFYGLGSFADEKKSTALFLLLLLATGGLATGASFIHFDIAAAVGGWFAVVAAHPSVAGKLKEIELEYLADQELVLEEILEEFEKRDIVIDAAGPEEERDVEIFELQRQGLTPRLWDPWVYTPIVYGENSKYRVAQLRPPGTTFLEEIQPPVGWYYEPELPWMQDSNPKGWVLDRGVRNVEIDPNDHWAYDYKDGARGEWRRRRWVRKCFRGALPPRHK